VGERVRPTVARVDLEVLKANYRAIGEHLKRERPTSPPGVISVVKANAYGHGAAQVGGRSRMPAPICWPART
jgi:alanine racemase